MSAKQGYILDIVFFKYKKVIKENRTIIRLIYLNVGQQDNHVIVSSDRRSGNTLLTFNLWHSASRQT
jgi:hypothetical protein